jgi:alkanesulfonate monooxygenase SsuD/methylene tetrahydromethanopterin reductase-like flavin-dependent oxidoreductase (luciferase family)
MANSVWPVTTDATDATDATTPKSAAPEVHLYLPQMRMSLEDLAARAQAAEAAGFAGLAMMDHLAPPAALDQPMFEALTTTMYLACNTERLTLGHLVLCDAFRHPAVLARQAVTIDHASGGRFELGLGAGSVPAELTTFGFAESTAGERVARLAETLEVLPWLLSGELVDYRGKYFTLEGAQQLPPPTRRIPIIVGGTGPKMMQLVAAHADWWNVPTHQVSRISEVGHLAGDARVSVQQMVTFIRDESVREETVALAQRRFGWMGADRLLIGNGPELVDALRSMAANGVERIYTWFTDFAPPEQLAAFGEQVLAEL